MPRYNRRRHANGETYYTYAGIRVAGSDIDITEAFGNLYAPMQRRRLLRIAIGLLAMFLLHNLRHSHQIQRQTVLTFALDRMITLRMQTTKLRAQLRSRAPIIFGEVWDRAPLEGPGPDRARCTALRGAITSLNLMSKRLLLVTKYSA